MKKSTIEYRRGKQTRSPYAKREKGKRAYRYSSEGPTNELVASLKANLLQVFPRLAMVDPAKRTPHWLWNWVPRGANYSVDTAEQ